MGWHSLIYDQDPSGWYLGKFVQIENTWVWSTQNRIGLYDMEIPQKISKPDNQMAKTKVKKSIDQKLKLWRQIWENWSRSSGYESHCQRGVERGQGECYQWKAKGRCSRGDKCSFRHDEDEHTKPIVKTAPPSEPPTPRGRSASRKRNLRGRSPSGKTNRQPCRDFLKGTCTKLPCDDWHPPECQFYKTEM